MSIFDKAGGRKFLIFVILSICATIFVVLKTMTMDDWKTFEAAIAAMYIAGNIGDSLLKPNQTTPTAGQSAQLTQPTNQPTNP